MAFVHGHARDTGWVVAHVRAPIDAEDGQLALDGSSAEDDTPATDPEGAPPGGGAPAAGEPDADQPVSGSAGRPASTRS